MNVSIEDPSVPPGPPGGPPAPAGSRRRFSRWWIVGAVVVFLSLVYGGLNAYEVPYYEYHPGSARAVAPLIDVDGAEVFPPTHDIAYTTITLRSSTAWSWLMAHLDDDVEIRTREQVLGDRSASERREINLQAMDTSKLDAVRSALVALGYEVPISVDGQFVVDIVPGSNAEGVLEAGDVITSIEGTPIVEQRDVDDLMEGRLPGETVELGIEHADGSTETAKVTLVESSDDTGRGVVGVFLVPRGAVYEFPIDVEIHTEQVGGPSAGLAFTLGLLDVLTPGELTGPHSVAVTGTIDAYGNVGKVGGVPQKTAAVIEAGHDVFLVPSAEVEMATERAGDDLQVFGVDTLKEALDVLASLGGSGMPTGSE